MRIRDILLENDDMFLVKLRSKVLAQGGGPEATKKFKYFEPLVKNYFHKLIAKVLPDCSVASMYLYVIRRADEHICIDVDIKMPNDTLEITYEFNVYSDAIRIRNCQINEIHAFDLVEGGEQAFVQHVRDATAETARHARVNKYAY